ncbi:hypothetical protein BL107_05819 [Synechococcus sp. BL107]|nr:hypothetical protein BL107_05819 [Synechococcus sp. BL107]
MVFKKLWDESLLKKVAEECLAFTDWDEKKIFKSVSVNKRSCGIFGKLPPKTKMLLSYCNSSKFLEFLEEITGEKGLIPDPHLLGGGIHSSLNDGFLKMHADFNWHDRLKLYRRLNLLIYLNPDWDKSWGGELCLACKTDQGLHIEKTIEPLFNTTVLFTTTDQSFHGHPEPMSLPEGKFRNSLALYYYVSEKPVNSADIQRSYTDYRQLNGQRYL